MVTLGAINKRFIDLLKRYNEAKLETDSVFKIKRLNQAIDKATFRRFKQLAWVNDEIINALGSKLNHLHGEEAQGSYCV
jgi:hypothetical protein